MSRYFSRLLQRAAGAQRTAVTPTAPSSRPSSSEPESPDPFEAQAPLDMQPPKSAALPPSTPSVEGFPRVTLQNERADPPDASEMAAERSTPVEPVPRARPAGPLEPQLEPRTRAPPAPRLEPDAAIPKAAPSPALEPASRLPSPTPIEPTLDVHRSRQPIEQIHPAQSTIPLQPPAPAQSVSIIRERPNEALPGPQLMPTRIHAHEHEPIKAPRIEPVIDAVPAPTPTVEQPQPRLQIGRLNIEVIPATPARPAPQPRSFRRPRIGVAIGGPGGASPPFGLGQM